MIEDLVKEHFIFILTSLSSLVGIYTLFKYKLAVVEKRLDKHDKRIIDLEKENIHNTEMKINIKWIMETVNEIKETIKNLH